MNDTFLGIDWAIPWFIFALSVGVIVSLDVWGLVASQWEDFKIDPNTGKSNKTPFKQARTHAIVHAALFLIYMVFVFFGVAIMRAIVEPITLFLLRCLPNIGFFEFIRSLGINFPEVRQSLTLIFGTLIIMFVWVTYKNKLSEDHRKKLKAPSDPAVDMRFDIKIAYRAYEFFFPNSKYLMDIAMALAVAVDMLAVSAIIRVLFKSQEDSGYKGAHFEIFGSDYYDIPFFAILICSVVFIVTHRAAVKIQEKGHSPPLDWLFKIRIAEPIFVFSILFLTLPHLIGSSELVGGRLDDFLLFLIFGLKALAFGILMTVTLVLAPGRSFKRGLSQIKAATRSGTKMGQQMPADVSRFVGWTKWEKLKYFGASIFDHFPGFLMFSAIAISLSFTLAISHGIDSNDPLTMFVQILYGLVIIFTLFVLYVKIPCLKIEEWEIRIDKFLFSKKYTFRKSLPPVLAFFTVMAALHYLYTGNLFIFINDTRSDISGLSVAVLFPFFVFALFKWRTRRQESAAKSMIASGSGIGNYHYQENVGELLKAAGVAALLWKIWL